MDPMMLLWLILILGVVAAFSPALRAALRALKGLAILFVAFLVAGVLAGQLVAYAGGTGTGVRKPAVRRNAVSPAEFHGAAQAASNRALGKRMAARYGWVDSQWNALDRLVQSESGWRNTAQNPTSTAYGIGQFLDKTWAGYGYRKTSNPRRQIAAMLKYIRARYGTPEQAWEFKKRHNWY